MTDLTNSILERISRYESLTIELVVSGSPNVVDRTSTCSIRHLPRDIDVASLVEKQILRPATIDIILGVGIPQMTSDLKQAMDTLSSLLVPGGRIILGSADVSGQASAVTSLNLLAEAGLVHVRSHVSPITPTVQSIQGVKPSDTIFNQSPSVQEEPLGDKQLNVINFVRGEEIPIQDLLLDLDKTPNATLWIHASTDANGGAARGFSRCLRREFLSLNIHLVLFHPKWSAPKRLSMLKSMSEVKGLEEEMYVDEDGRVCFPRFVPIATQSITGTHFSPTDYWTLEGVNVVQPALPLVPPNHVLIHVEKTSSADSPRSVFGTVVDAGATCLVGGTRVLGIADSSLGNYTLVHEDCLVFSGQLEKNSSTSLAGVALGAVVASLAFGSSFIRHLSRLSGRTILITNSDTPIGVSLLQVLSALQLKVVAIASKVFPSDFKHIAASDYIISGFTDETELQLLKSLSGGHVYLWNDSSDGLRSAMRTKPWLVSEALGSVLEVINVHDGVTPAHDPKDLIPPTASMVDVVPGSQLFDPRKTYLLIGGIGSLGCEIAQWMYKVHF